MPDPRWQRLKDLFAAAAALPAAERDAYLHAQGADDEMVREVRSLLAAHPPTAGRDGDDAIREGPGSRIGPYKLLECIGEGGFGTVFAAEQEAPVRRRVALKVLKAGMDTHQVVARFEQERQALAMMDHPNIARVFDGGSTPGGRPFFVMELVRGDPITDYCDRERLDPAERLRLFTDVGRAVQHAHQKGVIHRDLKPSNVLVTIVDGRPVAKVIDFGVAKATQGRLTERTLFTEHKQMIGTPLYMSPEQAHISGVDVDTRSDVYSLGVLLYELLTGTTPFRREELLEAGLLEMHRVLREVEPQKPSTRVATLGRTSGAIAAQRRVDAGRLGGMLRGDLDWIVMKCLEKERSRRYETANDLVRDVERHLAGEAVLAAPPSVAYRLRKLVRRRRGQVAAAAVVFLVAGTGIASVLWSEQKRADDAVAAAARLQAAADERVFSTYVDNIRVAEGALRHHDVRTARQRLDACPESLRNWEWRYLDAQCSQAIATFVGRRTHFDIDWETDFERHWDGEAADLWDTTLHAPFRVPTDPPLPPVMAATRIPSGARVVVEKRERGTLQLDVFDVVEGKARRIATLEPSFPAKVTITEHRDDNTAVFSNPALSAFSPGGRWLIVCAWGSESALWDCQSWTRVRSLSMGVDRFSFSASGDRLALAPHGYDARVCDTATGENSIQLVGHEDGVDDIRFSPDGRQVVTVATDRTCRVWDATNGAVVASFATGDSTPHAACFTPDGTRVVVGTESGRVHVWDVRTHAEILQFEAGSAVLGVAVSAEGAYFATACRDATVSVWDGAHGKRLASLIGSEDLAYAPVFSPDGNYLVATSMTGTRRVWSHHEWTDRSHSITPSTPWTCLDPDVRKEESPGGLDSCWFHPGSGHLHIDWTVVEPQSGWTLDEAYGSTSLTGLIGSRSLEEGLLYYDYVGPFALYRRHDETDAQLLVRDACSGQVLHRLQCDARVQHAEIGGTSTLAWVSERGTIQVHDLPSERVRCSLPAKLMPCSVHPSPDGRLLLVAADDAHVVDTVTGKVVCRLQSPSGSGTATAVKLQTANWGSRRPVAWSPDSRRVAGRFQGRTIVVWDASSGAAISSLRGHQAAVVACCFSPDGLRVATGGAWGDPTVRIWDAASGAELLTLREHTNAVNALAFSADGSILASVSGDGTCRVRRSTPRSHSIDRHRALATARLRVAPLVQRLVDGNRTQLAASLAEVPLDPDARIAAAALVCERQHEWRERSMTFLAPLLDHSCPPAAATAALAQLAPVRAQCDDDEVLPNYWQGLAQFRLGNHAEALAALTAIHRSLPDRMESRVHGLFAMVHGRLGNREQADHHLAELRKQLDDPRDRIVAREVLGEVEAVFAECFPNR